MPRTLCFVLLFCVSIVLAQDKNQDKNPVTTVAKEILIKAKPRKRVRTL